MQIRTMNNKEVNVNDLVLLQGNVWQVLEARKHTNLYNFGETIVDVRLKNLKTSEERFMIVKKEDGFYKLNVVGFDSKRLTFR